MWQWQNEMAATRRFSSAVGALATAGPGFLGCLGHGDWADRDALTRVVDDAGNAVRVRGVAAGWAHSACLVDGAPFVWGRRLEPPTSALRLSRLHGFVPAFARLVNATAVLLDTSRDLALRPAPVAVPGRARSVVCGAGVTALVLDDGALYAFGANSFGQCGVGAFGEAVAAPARVAFEGDEAPEIVDVALGFRHGLALDRDGAVWAWGKNDNGQLGAGDRETRATASRVALDEPCVAVGCGLAHSAALTAGGALLTWGKMRDPASSTKNAVAKSGPDVFGDALAPLRVARGARFVALACSNFHTAVADADGGVAVAGLEAGSREMVHAPRPVALPAVGGPWRLRPGVDAVALVGADDVHRPDLVPGLRCETTRVFATPVADVSLGWKHAVAAVT